MDGRSRNGMSFSTVSCCILPLVCVGALLQAVVLTGLGILKGALVLIPVALLTIPSWLLATILHWPRSFVSTYITVSTTQRLGPNLRMLALFVLPVPLVVWPMATVAGSVLFSLVVGFLWPLWGTVTLGTLLEGGKLLTAAVLEPLETAQTCAMRVWKFNHVQYFSYLDDMQRPYYGEPLDVSLLRLLIAAVLSVLCSLLSTLAVMVLGLLRLPFIIARALGEWMALLGKCPPKLMCLWLPLWMLGIPAIPVVVLAMFLMVLLGNALYLGPTCGVVAYLSTSSRPAYRSFGWALWTALDVMYTHIYSMDEAAVRMTGLGTSGLLPVPSQRFDGQRVPYASGAHSAQPAASHAAPYTAPITPLDQAWSTFEDICSVSVERAVCWGWVPRTDLADTEAYLFIGLPALALLNLIADAAAVPPDWMPGSGCGAAATAAAAEAEGKDTTTTQGEAVAAAVATAQGQDARGGPSAAAAGPSARRGRPGGAVCREGERASDGGVRTSECGSVRARAEVEEEEHDAAEAEAAGSTGRGEAAAGGGGGPRDVAGGGDDAGPMTGSVIVHGEEEEDDGKEGVGDGDGGDLCSGSVIIHDETDSEGGSGGVEEEEDEIAVGLGGPSAEQRQQQGGQGSAARCPEAARLEPCSSGAAVGTDVCQRYSGGSCGEAHGGERSRLCAAAAAAAGPGGAALAEPGSATGMAAAAADSPDGHRGGASSGSGAGSATAVAAAITPPPTASSRGADADGGAASERPGAAPAVAAELEATAVASSGAVAVLLGSEPLDPAVAHVLLEELAEHILSSDIGFTSAANPVRLYKSLSALQASPLEMRYMACHTVLLGDHRISDLVPTISAAAAPAAAAGTASPAFVRPSHAASHGGGAAAAAGSSGAPGHKGHTASGTGSALVTVGPSHSRRPSIWSLNGGAGGGGGSAAAAGHSRPGSGSNLPAVVGSSHVRPDSGAGAMRLFAMFNRDTAGTAAATAAAAAALGGASAPSSPQLAVVVRTSEPPSEVPEAAATAAPLPREGEPQAPAAEGMVGLPQRSRHCRGAASFGTGGAGGGGGVQVANGLLGTGRPDLAPDSGCSAAGASAGMVPTLGTPAEMADLTVPAGLLPAAMCSPEVSEGCHGLAAAAAAAANRDSLTGEMSLSAPSAPHTPALRLRAAGLSHLEPVANSSGPGQGAGLPTTTLPAAAPHHPHVNRWPFGRGHRRTRSQPVGVPTGSHGLGGGGGGGGGVLIPPSPRSVPGGGDAAVRGLARAAAAADGTRAATATGAVTASCNRVSEAGTSTVMAAESGGAAAAVPAVDPASAAAAAAAAAGLLLVCPQRLAQLHAFTAAVQSVATALSKKQRMKEIMGRLLAKYGTAGSVCEESSAAPVAGADGGADGGAAPTSPAATA